MSLTLYTTTANICLQDQWWLSGIFRDVFLLAFPKVCIEDFRIQTLLDKDYNNAVLSVDLELSASTNVTLSLLDAERKEVASSSQLFQSSGSFNFRLDIKSPNKWTAETPYLYYAVLVNNDNQQTICQRVGFRQVEIKDGVITVNGQRIVFRGVNRHEHNPKFGRAVPYEFMRNDLLQMKRHNINSIRTSHYPGDPRFYDLADELGFWIMDEADFECHGFSPIELAALTDEDKKRSKKGVISLECERAGYWITSKPEWEAAFLDRVKQLVHRDKNHASVILWSLGNESYYGTNIISMYNWVKKYDPTRPIHYEGDRDAETVDMYSLMYPDFPEILSAIKNAPLKKPLLLCEYLYGIGNGAGKIQTYVESFYKYPRFQGGFAWQWASQGLETFTPEGVRFFGYGGDFNDIINDGRENTHGFNFSDHTPKPALSEFKKALEPLKLTRSPTGFSLTNRYNFANLDHIKCEWAVVGDGFRSARSVLPLPNIDPGQTQEIVIEGFKFDDSKESYLEVILSLRCPELWAPAGHEICREQFLLRGPSREARKATSCPTSKAVSETILEIQGEGLTWKFDCRRGSLVSWVKKGTELLVSPPTLSFYRAMTDNDQAGDGVKWEEKLLKFVRTFTQSVQVESKADHVSIKVIARAGPPGLEWRINTTLTYNFFLDHVQILATGNPSGVNMPRTLARIGLDFTLASEFDRATWFGRGPGESYRDRKLAQLVGNWSSPIQELFTAFEYPQESGNRTDVRWVTFSSSISQNSITAKFEDQDGCSFNAYHYDTMDIDQARHPYELTKTKEPRVRLDWAHHGLGTAAIGPRPLPENTLENKEFSFHLTLN